MKVSKNMRKSLLILNSLINFLKTTFFAFLLFSKWTNFTQSLSQKIIKVVISIFREFSEKLKTLRAREAKRNDISYRYRLKNIVLISYRLNIVWKISYRDRFNIVSVQKISFRRYIVSSIVWPPLSESSFFF